MWLCCCGGTEDILVCVHTKRTYTTSSSSGQVTRLDPDDGSEIWVSSLGVHGTSGRVRRAVSCKIGPDGTIYVFFDYPASGSGGAFLADYGGVCALDKADGSIIWENDLGSVSTTGNRPLQAFPNIVNAKGCLALYEPQNAGSVTFSIWLAAYRQTTTEDFLFEIDPGDGTVLQSFSVADITGSSLASNARVFNIEVANDGDLFVGSIQNASTWNKITSSGSFVSDFRSAPAHLSAGPEAGELSPDTDDSFWASFPGVGSSSTSTDKELLLKGEPLATNDITVLEGFDRLAKWVELGGGLYGLPSSDHDIVDDDEPGDYTTSNPIYTSFHKKTNGGGIVMGRSATTYSKFAGGSDSHRGWLYTDDDIGRPHLTIIHNQGEFPGYIRDIEIAKNLDVYIAGTAVTTVSTSTSDNMLTKWNLAVDTLDWKIDSSTEDVTYPSTASECFEVQFRTVPA